MEGQKQMEDQELDGIRIENLTEQEAEEVKIILQRFLKAYKESGEDQETFEWLEKQLGKELPDKTEDELRKIKEEIICSIKEYDADLSEMKESIEKGGTKEKWFADKLEEGAKGVAVNAYGDYLNQMNKPIELANQQMMRTILRNDGGYSECRNLDGFIAEQYHVNCFNAQAVQAGSPYRARVCVPEKGGYPKSSVDVQIDNIVTGQKGVERYQFKFYKDSKSTVQNLKQGNYSNQRKVIPPEYVTDVQAKLPNQTVTDHIGGTDKVKVESIPLTKEEAKRMQTEFQESGIEPRVDWNVYNTRELALSLGRQAGVAGMQAAFITTGIELAGKAMSGEPIDGGEVVETALRAGADTGIKAVAGGALTVACEKGILSILPPGTAPGTIAKIACIGIENIKIMLKVAKGELTVSEALEQMGRTSTAMVAGLSCAGIGAITGAAALAWIPIVGPVLGGLVGGMLGYAAGSKFGEVIYNGTKKIVDTGKKIIKNVWESIKSAGRGIRELLPW